MSSNRNKDRVDFSLPGFAINKLTQVALLTLSGALLALVGLEVYHASKTYTLKLAAGSRTGDSYILCQALQQVVARHYPNVRISLLETAGTVQNLRMLDEDAADLATAQADVAPLPSARSVAVLFDDTFQLLVRDGAGIAKFSDLRGHRIALPPGGGQFDSFLRVAGHFHLSRPDFDFVGGGDPAADQIFAQGNADALFRVRALGNPDIQRLVNAGGVQFLEIPQAAGMKIHQPAFEPAEIPAGTYLGQPVVPPQPVSTIAVHRMLFARAGVAPEAVRALTAVLLEDRQEIAQAIPERFATVGLLLAQVRRPDAGADFCPALHPGAASYYDKDKPSFVQKNADYLGLLLSVVVMIGSWIWQFKRWMEQQQKNAGDAYSSRVMAILTAAQNSGSTTDLDQMRTELLSLLTSAVRDLDQDKLSEESFQSFRAVLQISLEVTRERREAVAARLPRQSQMAAGL